MGDKVYIAGPMNGYVEIARRRVQEYAERYVLDAIITEQEEK